MDEIRGFDVQILSKAVVLWTGYETAQCPTREDAALEKVFPIDEAAKLLTIVKMLEDDCFKSQAHITARDLSEMKDIAFDDFRRLHPELPKVIADAFAWCYTFDYK